MTIKEFVLYLYICHLFIICVCIGIFKKKRKVDELNLIPNYFIICCFVVQIFSL